jgi:FKBP-type peptidyl-prolyl cis-trans isomerase
VFKIGEGQVIKGWDQGVATMKVGEHAFLTCAPEFAYGKRGSPPKIPANATLIFEVWLLSFDNTSNVTEDKGVRKSVKQEGSGHNRPTDHSTVVVKYEGRVAGAPADSKPFVSHMDAPVTLQLGKDATLAWGLEEGIKNMHVGERSTIFVNANPYGYGSAGNAELGVPANADLEFDVELVSFERGPDSSTMDFAAKLAHAVSIKDLGNLAFKSAQLSRALKVYRKAIDVFPYLGSLDDEQKAQVTTMQLACMSNMAICYAKQGAVDKVIDQARAGLELNPKHVKLLFQRALALMKKGLLVEAEADLKAAQAADPSNKDVARELAAIKAKNKAIADREKKAFGGFFGKVKLVSDEEEAAAKRAAEAAAKSAAAAADDSEMSDDEEEAAEPAAAAEAAPAEAAAQAEAAAADAPMPAAEAEASKA